MSDVYSHPGYHSTSNPWTVSKEVVQEIAAKYDITNVDELGEKLCIWKGIFHETAKRLDVRITPHKLKKEAEVFFKQAEKLLSKFETLSPITQRQMRFIDDCVPAKYEAELFQAGLITKEPVTNRTMFQLESFHALLSIVTARTEQLSTSDLLTNLPPKQTHQLGSHAVRTVIENVSLYWKRVLSKELRPHIVEGIPKNEAARFLIAVFDVIDDAVTVQNIETSWKAIKKRRSG